MRRPKATHHIYTPHWPTDPKPDEDCCRETIHVQGRGGTFHQCGSKPSVFEDVERGGKTVRMGFCKKHSLGAKQARKDKSHARVDRQIEWDNLKGKRSSLLHQIGLAAVTYVEEGNESTMEHIRDLAAEYKAVKAKLKKMSEEK